MKWCRSENVCRKCSQKGPNERDCVANETKGHHCENSHQDGSYECPRWLQENKNRETMGIEHATIQRAREILQINLTASHNI